MMRSCGQIPEHYNAPGELASGSAPGVAAVQNRIPERWQPKRLSELECDLGEIEWVWEGYLAGGFTTLFTGLWKAGKTTLLTDLLKAMPPPGVEGEFAGKGLRRRPVLIVTEENERLWVRRRDELAIPDFVEIIPQPFLGRPSPADWSKFIDHLARLSQRDAAPLIIFDSLFQLWSAQDENDAARVNAALAPLQRLTASGAAVLLVAHPRKGDAGQGQATRGSGALPSSVDIIMEMRRVDAERSGDTRRSIVSLGRFDECTPELIIDFDPATGYSAIGTKRDATSQERIEEALTLLSSAAPGMTAQEVRSSWLAGSAIPAPSVKNLRRDLDTAAERGLVVREGRGRRGDPFRYHLPGNEGDSIPDSSDSGGESASPILSDSKVRG